MADRTLQRFFDRRDNVLAMPIVQDAMKRGFTGELKIPGSDVKVKMTSGQNPSVGSGGVWKPLLAAGAVAGTGGLAAAMLPAVGGAAAGMGGGATLGANLGAASAIPAAAGGGGVLSGGGILGTLGSIGKMGAKLGDIGEVATGAAAGLGAGRHNDNAAEMYAATANNRAQADAADFNMGAPVTRAQQVAKGDLMSADIPQSARTGSGRDVSFSGGVGPQMFGADTTSAGNELKRQALQHLMSGDDKLVPQMPEPQKAGIGENILGGVGLGTSLLGSLGGLRKRYGTV